MSKPAMIKGDFVNVKFFPSRASCQIIVETDISQGEAIIEALGAPRADKSIPVAVARLTEPKAEPAKDHRLSQQASMRCAEPIFWRFISEVYCWRELSDEKDAAAAIRQITDVESRAEFDTDKHAAARWQDLHGKYLVWKQAA